MSVPGCAWVAAWSIVCAVQIAADPFLPRALFSIALGHQPPLIALTIGGVMGAGSVLALAGLLTRTQNRSRAWAIERAGWWLTRIVTLTLIERDAVRLREAVHTGQGEGVAHE